MSGGEELVSVENAWLDNLLNDAQTTTTIDLNGSRPRTTNTGGDQYASVLPSGESLQHQQPQCVKSEHSYSLGNGTGDFSIKIEPQEHGAYQSH